IRLHKLIAPAFGRIQNRGSPFLGAVDDPVVELCRNLAQHIPADGIEISIRAKETNHALLLLKRLDKSIEEDAIETSVLKSDVILVLLVESVHGHVSFQFSQNRRINPDTSTSSLHAGLSSTRHLEPCDGLRRRRLRVRCEFAGAGKIQSGFTTPACGHLRAIEHCRGLWRGKQYGVRPFSWLRLSLSEGSRHRLGTV